VKPWPNEEPAKKGAARNHGIELGTVGAASIERLQHSDADDAKLVNVVLSRVFLDSPHSLWYIRQHA